MKFLEMEGTIQVNKFEIASCSQCSDLERIFKKHYSKHYIEFKNGSELEFCSNDCKRDWKKQNLDWIDDIELESK